MSTNKLMEAATILNDAIQQMIDRGLIRPYQGYPYPGITYDTRGKGATPIISRFHIDWDDLQSLREWYLDGGEYSARVVDHGEEEMEHAALYVSLDGRTTEFVACRPV